MQVEVIDPKKTAMIVVDMQNDFVAVGAAMETPAARAVVPKLAEALNICRDARFRVEARDGRHRDVQDAIQRLLSNPTRHHSQEDGNETPHHYGVYHERLRGIDHQRCDVP